MSVLDSKPKTEILCEFLGQEGNFLCEFLPPETVPYCQIRNQEGFCKETGIFCHFLDAETDIFVSFWIQKLTNNVSLCSGSRILHNGSNSERAELYGF